MVVPCLLCGHGHQPESHHFKGRRNEAQQSCMVSIYRSRKFTKGKSRAPCSKQPTKSARGGDFLWQLTVCAGKQLRPGKSQSLLLPSDRFLSDWSGDACAKWQVLPLAEVLLKGTRRGAAVRHARPCSSPPPPAAGAPSAPLSPPLSPARDSSRLPCYGTFQCPVL